MTRAAVPDAGPVTGTVVITDCDHGSVDDERAVLAPYDVTLRLADCHTADDVVRAAGDADVLVVQYAPIPAAVLDALPRCRLVVRYGVGVDNVDVDAATTRGVWVANVPDYGTDEVADHAVALTLALLRGVAVLDRSVRAGEWDYRVARPLHRLGALTFGVVGCGAIGRAVARRVSALGMRVLGSDIRPVEAAGPIEPVPLADLLARADVVSLHAALTPGAPPLLGPDELAALKPGAYLVNTARGGLVDPAALLRALDDGRLAGAGLDVLAVEPPDETGVRLVRHPRVVATPHAAWYSEESFRALKSEVAREAVRVLAGQPPRSPVNKPDRPR